MMTWKVKTGKSVEAHKPVSLVHTVINSKRTCLKMVEMVNTQSYSLTSTNMTWHIYLHTHTLELIYSH